jgi:hypothetical protein
MRNIFLLFVLALVTFEGVAQQAMLNGIAEEVIHTGIPAEIRNAELANDFWDNIREENEKLVAVRDSIAALKAGLEKETDLERVPEKKAQHTGYQQMLDACDQMMATNERLLNGQIAVRSIDSY